MFRATILALIVAFAGIACSFDASEPPGEFDGWDLGDRIDADGPRNDGGEVVEDGGAARDSGSSADTGSSGDGGATSDSGSPDGGPADSGATDSGTSTDSGMMPDVGTPDTGVDMSVPDMGMANCTSNTQCSAGEVCCPDVQGNGTCQPEADCLVGGFCGSNAECASGETCCDLSGIGSGDVCLTRCFGGGGGGTACTTNSDCNGGDVCCPQLNGQAECTAANSCFSGGACASDADCRGQQKCCNLQIGSLCFDRCSL